MNNKFLASLTLASFAVIFLTALAEAGDTQDTFYAIGALGTLIFGGLVLSKLHRHDKHAKFPYVGGGIMMFFWMSAIIIPGGIQLFALPYLAQGIYGSVKLYRI